jgi:hypothetical protein
LDILIQLSLLHGNKDAITEPPNKGYDDDHHDGRALTAYNELMNED